MWVVFGVGTSEGGLVSDGRDCMRKLSECLSGLAHPLRCLSAAAQLYLGATRRINDF